MDTPGCPEAQLTPLTLGSRAGGCSSSWPGGGLGVKGQSLVSGAESWIRPSSPAAQFYGLGQVATHPGPGSPICPGTLIVPAPRVAGRREACWESAQRGHGGGGMWARGGPGHPRAGCLALGNLGEKALAGLC